MLNQKGETNLAPGRNNAKGILLVPFQQAKALSVVRDDMSREMSNLQIV